MAYFISIGDNIISVQQVVMLGIMVSFLCRSPDES